VYVDSGGNGVCVCVDSGDNGGDVGVQGKT